MPEEPTSWCATCHGGPPDPLDAMIYSQTCHEHLTEAGRGSGDPLVGALNAALWSYYSPNEGEGDQNRRMCSVIHRGVVEPIEPGATPPSPPALVVGGDWA